MAPTSNRPDTSGSAVSGRRAIAAFTVPFAVWIAFIFAFEAMAALGRPPAHSALPVAYAAKSAICALLIAWLKPWRAVAAAPHGGAHSPACGWIVPGVAMGVLVAFLWIFPETPFAFGHFRAACEAYHRWLIMPLGEFPKYFDPHVFPVLPAGCQGLAFSPQEAGWPLALARLAGSAFVIAVAEEYFFRGFLMRWLRSRNWLSVPLSDFDAQSFWTVVAVFAFEHDRWFMGGVAGAAYGLLAWKTGGLRAPIVAHAVTNLLLGMHVIATEQYGFW